MFSDRKLKIEIQLTETFYKMKSLTKYTLIILILYIPLFALSMPSSMQCKNRHGCLNGGTLMMPRSLFGYCRCICPGNWGGPVCELTRYRTRKYKKLIRIKHTLRNMLSKRMVQS